MMNHSEQDLFIALGYSISKSTRLEIKGLITHMMQLSERRMTANAYQAVLAQDVVVIGSGPWPALGASPVSPAQNKRKKTRQFYKSLWEKILNCFEI
jgi:hypothetical protein